MKNNKKYPLEAIGISNGCYPIDNQEKIPNTDLGIQFFEVDIKPIPNEILDQVLTIFPEDCLMFETRKGFHFIGFSVQQMKTTLLRALNLSYVLGKEITDYARTKLGCLILRTSPKVEKKTRLIVADKPKFSKILKKPVLDSNISIRHLKVFLNLGIPLETYNSYVLGCNTLSFGLRHIFYQTSQYQIRCYY